MSQHCLSFFSGWVLRADVHQTDPPEEDAPAEEAGARDGFTEEEVSALPL